MSNHFAHGYALLIGVGTTAESRYSLPVTVKDVQALKTVLIDPNLCAYLDDSEHIRLLQNEQTTRSAILDGLTWLKEKATTDRNATIVVFYSGHGGFDESSKCYYLLQHDFNSTDIANTALSAQEFTEALRQIQAKRLWVVIDSCHAEGMATAKGELPADFIATALPKGVIDALKQGEGRAVFTSSRGSQSSYIRPDGSMSIYTYHLIEALRGAANQPGDSKVMLSNLINHLRKTVPESARTLCKKEQTPFFDTAMEDFPIAMLRGRRTLLIWDNLETLNAEERDMIAEFLRKLPTSNKAIITSRRRTGESAVTIRLDRLLEAEALELMQAKGKSHPRLAQELNATKPEILTALYDASGGNPLALDWTLGQVAHKGYSISDALERLRNAAKSPDLYGFLFADAAETLSENDRTVLSALAVFLTPAKTAALADATDLAITEIQVSLERLVTLSLVNELDGERFGLHPLTRTYIVAAVGKTDTIETAPLSGIRFDSAAQGKVLRYWVDFAQKYGGEDKDAYQTHDKLEAEWQNLEGVATTLWEMAGIPGTLKDQQAAQMLIDLENALSNFLRFRGYWDEWVRLAEWRYQAGKALDQWSHAGWGAYHVAWIHLQRADTDRTASSADQMKEMMEQGGNFEDKAFSTRVQGVIAERRQDWAEAERLYQEALVIYRKLGNEKREAIVLTDLGRFALLQGQYDRAESYFKQGLVIEEKLGNKEKQADSYGHLGLLALNRNRPTEARSWYDRELALAQKVGQQNSVAHAQSGLARVLEEEGRYAEALPLAQAALEIRERLRYRNLDFSRQLVERLQRKVGME